MLVDLEFFFVRAMELAEKGEGHTRPNPPVGAILVRNGKVIGEGWHHRCGEDHAEVMAIKDAVSKGKCTKGATIYVTLEPCSKSGRVGACTDAIAAAGIAHVEFAMEDPNPTNRGKAKRALSKFGITCKRAKLSEELKIELQRQLAPFAKHVITGLPLVTVKIAMSLDGKISDRFGDAKWISSEKSRMITGQLREQVDAIMVGAETIRNDNPSLLSHGNRNNDLIRVVISKSGKLPKNAQVFTDGAPNPTLVFSDALLAIRELGKMGVMHVLCEGGLKLATSMAKANLVDRWITVLSPCIIGEEPISKAFRFNAEDAILGVENFE